MLCYSLWYPETPKKLSTSYPRVLSHPHVFWHLVNLHVILQSYHPLKCPPSYPLHFLLCVQHPGAFFSYWVCCFPPLTLHLPLLSFYCQSAGKRLAKLQILIVSHLYSIMHVLSLNFTTLCILLSSFLRSQTGSEEQQHVACIQVHICLDHIASQKQDSGAAKGTPYPRLHCHSVKNLISFTTQIENPKSYSQFYP